MPLLDLLPTTCGACGAPGASPCGACVPRLRSAPALRAPEPLASLRALLRYEGPAARLVLGLKARHERSAVGWLADGMALLVPSGTDLVTWAPTTARRSARRGVDHARLLAVATAARAGVRCHPALRRAGGPAQHGRSRADRLATGPSFDPVVSLDGLVVAVIDDVTTTGATVAAAGSALRSAGSGAVHAVCAAAVPDVRVRASGPSWAD